MQPEVANELTRGWEAADVADHRDQCRGGDHVQPRDRHQPSHVSVLDDALRDQPFEVRKLAGEEVQLIAE